MLHGLLAFQHVAQRLVASARAGSFGLRKRASFLSYTIEQDGTALLTPREPSLSVVFIPLALIVVALGAGAGFYS
jgi:hypothetical protein